MRILALADLHGDHRIYEWLGELSAAQAPEVVILAGDLLGCPDGFDTVEEAQRADAKQILNILGRIACPVFYVMGNDDLVELESRNGTIRTIHGQRIEYGDLNFVGYQYSLPFMGGVFEKEEDGIRDDLSAIEALVDEHTVFVTHSPAHGILDVGVMAVKAGSVATKELIERRNPRLHIHGHIHQEFGREDRHFNVAAAGFSRAIIIDTTDMSHTVLTGPGPSGSTAEG